MFDRLLSVAFLLLLSTACTTVRHPSPFDPAAFLNRMTETGGGTCRLSNKTKVVFVPCRFYESDDSASIFVALYHPKQSYLLSIREIRPDGTQGSVWNRPSEVRKSKGISA